jgi:tetratricopeptide (TPR) repeat protein
MVRVILTLMIKNEAAIVTRCIGSARPVADAVCVCDTGSTDTTLDVLAAYLPALGVPTKVTRTPWVDFGTSRTESMRATVAFCDELEWDKKSTYSLVLDADMVLRVTDAFDKSALRCSSYRMKQQTSRLVYYNIRLMRLSDPWVCVGPTHEYWDCAVADATVDSGTVETAYIEDVGDGKCKDDKFERDERLLRAALATDPTNARHMFYLAQTLRDRGDAEAAIEWYQRRVEAGEAGGWVQEVWYSMYQTAAMYYKLRRMPEMEYWGLKAQELTGRRAECLYLLARAFRETGQHHKAWHYYELGSRIAKKIPSADSLFVEPEVYTRLFEYERTILSYYVLGPVHHAESLRDVVRYMNVHGTSENTWSNMEFYVTRVPSTRVRALSLPPIGPYVASSVSVLRSRADCQQYVLNVRYVNYRISPDGSYLVDGGRVSTRNFCAMCDADFNVGPLAEMECPEADRSEGPEAVEAVEAERSDEERSEEDRRENEWKGPEGLEDVRLYYAGDEIRWVAASFRDGIIEQVRGTYDVAAHKLRAQTPMAVESTLGADRTDGSSGPDGYQMPDGSSGQDKSKRCEKNWIPLPEELEWTDGYGRIDGTGRPDGTRSGERFIYEWHPFTVGVCESRDSRAMATRVIVPTPPFFERIRGSSNVVEHDGALYAVVHLVGYPDRGRQLPRRRYYHVVVRLAVGSISPVVEAYTMPFYFVENQIEYCLGIELRDETLFAFVSQNDADPVVVEIPFGALEFVPLTVV